MEAHEKSILYKNGKFKFLVGGTTQMKLGVKTRSTFLFKYKLFLNNILWILSRLSENDCKDVLCASKIVKFIVFKQSSTQAIINLNKKSDLTTRY